MLRISGYGQTGPYRDRPGFGVVAEALGGLRYLTAEPGRTPVRVGVSIGDTIAALHGVIGALMALYHRKVHGGPGQVVDVALTEAVFNCMESLIPEYSAFGAIREPAGSALPGIAPSNAYPCLDGMVLVAGNGDSIFKRLMQGIGRQDLADDPQLGSNEGRVQRVAEIDGAIADFTRVRKVEEVLGVLNAQRVPGARIYNARDMAEDPQYRARGMIRRITTREGDALDVPGIVPKLSLTPGDITRLAPHLGADTAEVLASIGIDAAGLAKLREKNIV
jgi:formyl-CoA transferase